MGEKERLAEELTRQQALYTELKKMRGRGEEMDMLQQLEQVLIQDKQVISRLIFRLHQPCCFYSVNYENVNYSVKYSIVNCKYLLSLQDFFFIIKPKQHKKCQYS